MIENGLKMGSKMSRKWPDNGPTMATVNDHYKSQGFLTRNVLPGTDSEAKQIILYIFSYFLNARVQILVTDDSNF